MGETGKGKSHLKVVGFGVGLFEKPRKMDIEERRYMTLVEETNMAEINGLLEQHRRWNHAPVDEVPSGPHVPPFVQRGQTER